jgi:hypothetical protein
MKAIEIKTWPGGHVHVGFYSWFGSYRPETRVFWFQRRCWNSRFGLRQDEQRHVHIKGMPAAMLAKVLTLLRRAIPHGVGKETEARRSGTLATSRTPGSVTVTTRGVRTRIYDNALEQLPRGALNAAVDHVRNLGLQDHTMHVVPGHRTPAIYVTPGLTPARPAASAIWDSNKKVFVFEKKEN